MEKEEKNTKKQSKKKHSFYAATGRRKRSVARVWLYDDKGDFTINGRPINEVFTSLHEKQQWIKPFHTIGISHPKSKYSGSIKVNGGGITGQIEAIQLAISNALVKIDPSFKTLLRKAGLSTRDPREVERKKPSQPKARKKPQYSKR
jgi:small subunit ribosomal protein S9